MVKKVTHLVKVREDDRGKRVIWFLINPVMSICFTHIYFIFSPLLILCRLRLLHRHTFLITIFFQWLEDQQSLGSPDILVCMLGKLQGSPGASEKQYEVVQSIMHRGRSIIK